MSPKEKLQCCLNLTSSFRLKSDLPELLSKQGHGLNRYLGNLAFIFVPKRGHVRTSFSWRFPLYNNVHFLFFFLTGGGHRTARMASSNTVLRPRCVRAEHSRYFTEPGRQMRGKQRRNTSANHIVFVSRHNNAAQNCTVSTVKSTNPPQLRLHRVHETSNQTRFYQQLTQTAFPIVCF